MYSWLNWAWKVYRKIPINRSIFIKKHTSLNNGGRDLIDSLVLSVSTSLVSLNLFSCWCCCWCCCWCFWWCRCFCARCAVSIAVALSSSRFLQRVSSSLTSSSQARTRLSPLITPAPLLSARPRAVGRFGVEEPWLQPGQPVHRSDLRLLVLASWPIAPFATELGRLRAVRRAAALSRSDELSSGISDNENDRLIGDIYQIKYSKKENPQKNIKDMKCDTKKSYYYCKFFQIRLIIIIIIKVDKLSSQNIWNIPLRVGTKRLAAILCFAMDMTSRIFRRNSMAAGGGAWHYKNNKKLVQNA